jgi:hypothetical protein
MRFLRPLGVVFLVVLSIFVVVSVALAVMLILAVPMRRTSLMTGGAMTSAPSWAFPGLAFRPMTTRADATGWRVAYVLVGKSDTLVVSVGTSRSQSVTMANGQTTVTLSDAAGHVNPPQTSAALPIWSDSSASLAGIPAITAFSALQGRTTAVFVHHAVSGGGMTRIPVALAGLASLPPPLHPNVTRASGWVRVTLTTVTRGAVLSEVDLQAHGFADPGGELTTISRGNATTTVERVPQAPANVTMRTAAGVDLAPQVAPGPVSKGKVMTAIGFITPLRGTVVRLTIDNYELSDQPLSRRTTFGRWSFTFRMP